MQFSLAPVTFLSALSTISFAAPNPIVATPLDTPDLEARRTHRAKCTIVGRDSMTQNTCGQVVNCIGAAGSLSLSCEGKDAEGMGYWNTKKMPNNQVLKPSDTGLPYDLEWWVKRKVGAFTECWARHGKGEWVKGTPSGTDIELGVGHVKDSHDCTVVFNVYGDCKDAKC